MMPVISDRNPYQGKGYVADWKGAFIMTLV